MPGAVAPGFILPKFAAPPKPGAFKLCPEDESGHAYFIGETGQREPVRSETGDDCGIRWGSLPFGEERAGGAPKETGGGPPTMGPGIDSRYLTADRRHPAAGMGVPIPGPGSPRAGA
jgi:hypothetical protein